MDRIVAANQKGKNMKATDLLAMLSLSVVLSACANYQAGGYVQSGVQALLAGNNQTALSYLQAAAQQDPNYIYNAQLRLGVLSYLGRAQYLNKAIRKRARLWRKPLLRTRRQSRTAISWPHAGSSRGQSGGLKNIEASMKRMDSWLNYLNGNFPGEGWDPGGAIQARIKNALAMISSGNVEWPRLLPMESR